MATNDLLRHHEPPLCGIAVREGQNIFTTSAIEGITCPACYAALKERSKAAMSFADLDEKAPDGLDQHEAGAKLDAGKPRLTLVLGGFARALWAVGEVGTFGAKKYTDNGWMEVQNGIERYSDAGLRHFLKLMMGEEKDSDSELDHLAHEAWNALAKLELRLREIQNAQENNHDEAAGLSCANRVTAGNN